MQIRLRERDALKKKVTLTIRKRFNLYIAIAASLLILIGISSIYFLNRPKSVPGCAQNLFEVPYGSKSLLTLPDGSRVWVNSGSRLSYNTGFGDKNRDIKIIGEAYFDVAKNPELPLLCMQQM
ncbi:MAG: FecR domain-containing protein [Chloroflexia bacterium]|nr:FecR domain-containing protein [Chloroflexia bacterium]